jgi:hypothetical protein
MIPDYGCPEQRQAYADAWAQARIERQRFDDECERNRQANFARVAEMEARAALMDTKG